MDTVMERIEEQFGAQSLAPGPAKRPGRWRKPVFSAGVLSVLAEAERHLASTGERSLGVDQLVLAMTSAPGVLAESLANWAQGFLHVPSDFILALPYALTLLGLVAGAAWKRLRPL